MSTATIPLAPRVWRVPTTKWDLINTFLFKDDDDQVTIVDCGLKNAPPRIFAALAEIGSGPQDVTRVLLTHVHTDHAGGAKRVADDTDNGITVHQDDAEFMRTGTLPPRDRSIRWGRLLRPPGLDAAPVAEELVDNALLPIGGGVRILHTPGHTPGHISLLHEPTGVLITGDAIWNMNSRITWPILAFCTNVDLNAQSADRLAAAEYEVAAFTHGPQISDNARETIRGFLRHPRKFRAFL